MPIAMEASQSPTPTAGSKFNEVYVNTTTNSTSCMWRTNSSSLHMKHWHAFANV